MGTPEFVAGWSEVWVAWDPLNLWLGSEEGAVPWRTEPLTCGVYADSGWSVPEWIHSGPADVTIEATLKKTLKLTKRQTCAHVWVKHVILRQKR